MSSLIKGRQKLAARNMGIPLQSTDDFVKVCKYKVLVIGDRNTGKSSIIKRYVQHHFSDYHTTTIGTDYWLKVLAWDSSTIVHLELWDLAGEERVRNMTRVFYSGAVGAFVVHDMTEPTRFEMVQLWKNDVDCKVLLPNGQPVPAVLLANKCDKASEDFPGNKMDDYCRDKGFHAWFKTSAKQDIGIDEAARCLVAKILENDEVIEPPQFEDTITLLQNQDQKKCCW